jgi:hypothetical protein
MAEDKLPRLPRQSVVFFLFCAGSLLFFILAGPLWSMRKDERLNRDIARTETLIREQEYLQTMHAEVRKNLSKGMREDIMAPARQPLSAEEARKVQEVFAEVAWGAGVAPFSAAIELASLDAGADSIMVAVAVGGEFRTFKDYMLAVLRRPFVEEIMEVRMVETQGGRELRARVRVAAK